MVVKKPTAHGPTITTSDGKSAGGGRQDSNPDTVAGYWALGRLPSFSSIQVTSSLEIPSDCEWVGDLGSRSLRSLSVPGSSQLPSEASESLFFSLSLSLSLQPVATALHL